MAPKILSSNFLEQDLSKDFEPSWKYILSQSIWFKFKTFLTAAQNHSRDHSVPLKYALHMCTDMPKKTQSVTLSSSPAGIYMFQVNDLETLE